MGFLNNIFSGSHDNVPLYEQSVVEVGDGQFSVNDVMGAGARAVNFQYILETGEIPANTLYGLETLGGNQRIDWSSDDAFTRAIDQVKNATLERIQESPTLQRLLNQESWNKEDRVEWERNVSTIVSEELDKIPGLGEYRTGNLFSLSGPSRHRKINDLSEDIENGTENIEFDCEQISVCEGVILQQLDNQLLPDTAANGDLKAGANYFYVMGAVNFSTDYSELGGHAYILSSATMNVIESTTDPSKDHFSPYSQNADPNYSFESFVRGKPLLMTDESVYTTDPSVGMSDVASLRAEQSTKMREQRLAQEKERAERGISNKHSIDFDNEGAQLQLKKYGVTAEQIKDIDITIDLIKNNQYLPRTPEESANHVAILLSFATPEELQRLADIENLRKAARQYQRENPEHESPMSQKDWASLYTEGNDIKNNIMNRAQGLQEKPVTEAQIAFQPMASREEQSTPKTNNGAEVTMRNKHSIDFNDQNVQFLLEQYSATAGAVKAISDTNSFVREDQSRGVISRDAMQSEIAVILSFATDDELKRLVDIKKQQEEIEANAANNNGALTEAQQETYLDLENQAYQLTQDIKTNAEYPPRVAMAAERQNTAAPTLTRPNASRGEQPESRSRDDNAKIIANAFKLNLDDIKAVTLTDGFIAETFIRPIQTPDDVKNKIALVLNFASDEELQSLAELKQEYGKLEAATQGKQPTADQIKRATEIQQQENMILNDINREVGQQIDPHTANIAYLALQSGTTVDELTKTIPTDKQVRDAFSGHDGHTNTVNSDLALLVKYCTPEELNQFILNAKQIDQLTAQRQQQGSNFMGTYEKTLRELQDNKFKAAKDRALQDKGLNIDPNTPANQAPVTPGATRVETPIKAQSPIVSTVTIQHNNVTSQMLEDGQPISGPEGTYAAAATGASVTVSQDLNIKVEMDMTRTTAPLSPV